MDLDHPIEEPEVSTAPTITDLYRVCLCSPTGLNVLADIMTMCHFLEKLDPNNPAMIAEYNIGQQILARCVPERIVDNYEMSVIQAVAGLRAIP